MRSAVASFGSFGRATYDISPYCSTPSYGFRASGVVMRTDTEQSFKRAEMSQPAVRGYRMKEAVSADECCCARILDAACAKPLTKPLVHATLRVPCLRNKSLNSACVRIGSFNAVLSSRSTANHLMISTRMILCSTVDSEGWNLRKKLRYNARYKHQKIGLMLHTERIRLSM